MTNFPRRPGTAPGVAPVAWLAWLAASAVPPVSLAVDTISYRSGTAAPVSVEVTIEKVQAGELYYTSARTGVRGQKPLENIVAIKAAGEPALTGAEEAYAAGRWDEALRGYAKSVDSTDREWVKVRASHRLMEAAAKTGQFPAVARAYVELVKTDPATAAQVKFNVPKQPDVLKPALEDVDRAVAGRVSPEQRELLQNFKAQLLVASGRGAEAQQVLERAAAAPAAASPAPVGAAPARRPVVTAAAAADATQRRAVADRALLSATQALQAKDPAKAAADIEAAKAAFTDAAQQAKALFLLAQAKEQQAETDATKLQDAAIAYMRVVAHFEGKPAGADVPAALWKVAEIQERLKNTDEAVQIYNQLANDPKLKGTPMAAAAARKVAELAKGAKG